MPHSKTSAPRSKLKRGNLGVPRGPATRLTLVPPLQSKAARRAATAPSSTRRRPATGPTSGTWSTWRSTDAPNPARLPAPRVPADHHLGPAARGAADPPCQARHQPYPARPSRRLPQTRMLGSPTIPRQRPGPLHPASTTRTSLHLHPDLHASLQAEEREPRCPVWPCHTADPCDTSQKQSCSPIRPCCTTGRKSIRRRAYTFLCSDECWPPNYVWPRHSGDPAANPDPQSYSPSCGGPVLNHRLRLCCRRGPRSLRQTPTLCHQQARLPPQGSSALV